MSNDLESFDCDVVVVGAGLAGLTAAWTLQKRGMSVRVFEAGAHVGGRIVSSRLGNHSVDRGAQFWTTNYRVIPGLVQEMGLAPQIRFVSPDSAFFIDGRFHAVSSARPWSVFSGGLLSFFESIGLATDAFATAWRDHGRNVSIADPWVDYDVPLETIRMRDGIRDRWIDPMLNGFYFHGTDTSAALVRAMSSVGRRGRLFCLTGGLGQLAERLAAQVDVQLNTPVEAVVSLSDRVRVKVGQTTWRAKHAILSVPAPGCTKNLHQPERHRASSARHNVHCWRKLDGGLPRSVENTQITRKNLRISRSEHFIRSVCRSDLRAKQISPADRAESN